MDAHTIFCRTWRKSNPDWENLPKSGDHEKIFADVTSETDRERILSLP